MELVSGSARSSASATGTSVEDGLSELFLRFSPDEEVIKGFAGKWTFYRPDSDGESGITSQFRCLRTYDLVSSEAGGAVKFQTFNEFEPTNGKARKRSIDGIFESSHLRSSADLFFSNNTSLSEADKEEGYPDCVYWRSAALDKEHVMRIAPHLPPNPNAAELEAKYPNWVLHNGPAGVFAFESFLMVGDERWSMGALYSLSDLTLISHFCICERLTSIDPSKAMDFDKFSYRTSAGRLPEEPATWMSTNEYRGEMSELIWDDDGEALRLPPRPASFNPPDPNSTTHRLFRYEDSCYAYYPVKLPEVHADSDKQFGEGAKFEMGLLHASGQKTFRRLILRYSDSGGAVSLTKELFKADGSFEFDRRQSQSVRRSFGSRRNLLKDHAGPIARSADHRAARLREAFSRAESGQDLESPTPSPARSPPPRMQSGGSDTLDSATISRLMEQSRART